MPPGRPVPINSALGHGSCAAKARDIGASKEAVSSNRRETCISALQLSMKKVIIYP